MVFDVCYIDITTKLETEINVCSVVKFVLKFKFPSFWRTSSKYGMKHQICG